jgi:hypothetical protein
MSLSAIAQNHTNPYDHPWCARAFRYLAQERLHVDEYLLGQVRAVRIRYLIVVSCAPIMARPYYEAKLLSQYGKNFRGCLGSVKAIIGPKDEDLKDFMSN